MLDIVAQKAKIVKSVPRDFIVKMLVFQTLVLHVPQDTIQMQKRRRFVGHVQPVNLHPMVNPVVAKFVLLVFFKLIIVVLNVTLVKKAKPLMLQVQFFVQNVMPDVLQLTTKQNFVPIVLLVFFKLKNVVPNVTLVKKAEPLMMKVQLFVLNVMPDALQLTTKQNFVPIVRQVGVKARKR